MTPADLILIMLALCWLVRRLVEGRREAEHDLAERVRRDYARLGLKD